MYTLENITPEAINELLDYQLVEPIATAVTIYLPTHKVGTSPNMTADQIRCKNLIHQAAKLLEQRHDGELLMNQLMAWLDSVAGSSAFWETQSESLLICARAGMMRLYHLPVDSEEYVAVDDRFHLAPLLGLVQEMSGYYLLMLGQHAPKLLVGGPYGLTTAGIDLPKTLESALNLDEISIRHEQQRSAAGNGRSFNGRGGAKDPAPSERLHYWRIIDQLITRSARRGIPLVLAGVDSEIAEYRSVAKYPLLLHTAIAANFSSDKHQLFAAAQAAIRTELLNPTRESALVEYMQAKGQTPKHAVNHLAAIRTAAENGQIDKLLVPGMRKTTDTVSDTSKPVPMLTFPFTLSLAQTVHDIASMVWSARGRVIDVEPEQMPERGAMLLATLRY